MELKPGAYYKTRDGRKAYVAGKAPEGLLPVVGWVDGHGSVLWNSAGYAGDGNFDLIEEWREPRTASCKRDFVLVDCPRESRRIAARLEGNECSQCRIIGRKTVEVSITEGEGM